jgi:hypothetical protein
VANPRAGLLSALPDTGFAAVFLITWIRPATFGAQMVKWLMLVMLMEFIIIHSSAFMGTVAFASADRSRRSLGILGFGAFYTLFAGAISLAFRSWWPLATFWGQTLNRLLGVILGQVPDQEQKAFVMRGWGAAVFFYVGGCMATVLLPVPRLGITSAVVAAQRIPGSGLWVDHPEKVIAFGVVYFGLTAWSELAGHAWAAKARGAAPTTG